MRLLAIDPGTMRSAFVALDTLTDRIIDKGVVDNDDLLMNCRGLAIVAFDLPDLAVIEKVEGFGMAVGAEVFETVYWSGRFAEALHPIPVERLGRRAVKLHLCGQARAKDPNVRQALIDRYGGPDAIGRKATPGPLYGVTGDVWAALAVAVTWADLELAA